VWTSPRVTALSPIKAGLICLNAAAPQLPTLRAMEALIDIAKLLAAALGAIVAVGAVVVGTLSWLLNHPD